jgi:hypothetical protein
MGEVQVRQTPGALPHDPLDRLARKILNAAIRYDRKMRAALADALDGGELLLQAKHEVEHGNHKHATGGWEQWRKEHVLDVPSSRLNSSRTAQKWQRLAERAREGDPPWTADMTVDEADSAVRLEKRRRQVEEAEADAALPETSYGDDALERDHAESPEELAARQARMDQAASERVEPQVQIMLLMGQQQRTAAVRNLDALRRAWGIQHSTDIFLRALQEAADRIREEEGSG